MESMSTNNERLWKSLYHWCSGKANWWSERPVTVPEERANPALAANSKIMEFEPVTICHPLVLYG